MLSGIPQPPPHRRLPLQLGSLPGTRCEGSGRLAERTMFVDSLLNAVASAVSQHRPGGQTPRRIGTKRACRNHHDRARMELVETDIEQSLRTQRREAGKVLERGGDRDAGREGESNDGQKRRGGQRTPRPLKRSSHRSPSPLQLDGPLLAGPLPPLLSIFLRCRALPLLRQLPPPSPDHACGRRRAVE